MRRMMKDIDRDASTSSARTENYHVFMSLSVRPELFDTLRTGRSKPAVSSSNRVNRWF